MITTPCALPAIDPVMLLLYPPVAKPGEPPAGIAMLAGALRQNGVVCQAVDLSLEGLVYLIERGEEYDGPERWLRRCVKNRQRNLHVLGTTALYGSFARYSQYQKAVLELNRLLGQAGGDLVQTSLANYHDQQCSPTASSDLLKMAEAPERSPFYSFYQQRLSSLIYRYQPSHIGVSINFLSQALNGFALIGMIRQLAPGAVIVVGGGLITSWMRGPGWNEPFSGLVDRCVAGCGVEPLLELTGRSMTGEWLPDFSDLRGGQYLGPGFTLPYAASSGCFWNRCSFCPERAEKNVYRGKSPEIVRTELATLVSRYRPVLVHFLDNAIPPTIVADFSPEHPGVPWYGFARIDRRLADLDFCRRLKASGCVMLKLGLESGSQRVLDQLDKGVDLDVAGVVLRNLKTAGIASYVYLLFGTPAEAEEDARRTMAFVSTHHESISFLNLALFNMPLNSHELGVFETAPFSNDDLALYTDFCHPQGWDRRSVRRFLDRDFTRRPEIAAIIRRDPPFFTSNHAPFFLMGEAVAAGGDG